MIEFDAEALNPRPKNQGIDSPDARAKWIRQKELSAVQREQPIPEPGFYRAQDSQGETFVVEFRRGQPHPYYGKNIVLHPERYGPYRKLYTEDELPAPEKNVVADLLTAASVLEGVIDSEDGQELNQLMVESAKIFIEAFRRNANRLVALEDDEFEDDGFEEFG